MKYKVCYRLEYEGEIEVEADSEEEAQELVETMDIDELQECTYLFIDCDVIRINEMEDDYE